MNAINEVFFFNYILYLFIYFVKRCLSINYMPILQDTEENSWVLYVQADSSWYASSTLFLMEKGNEIEKLDEWVAMQHTKEGRSIWK